MRLFLTGMAVSCAVVLGAAGCMKRKQSETAQPAQTAQRPLVVKEAPGAAHRAGWVKVLATSDSCVPETPSNYKGVCLAAAAFGDARRGQAPTQTVRLWGMTFRERYKGAERLQQNILLAAIELSPTADGSLRVTLFEQWPESESDIDYLGSACEQLDNHHFRGQGEPPEPRWMGRLWTGLGREEGPRRAQLQPTAQGYAGGEPVLELRAFPKGWMVATEEQDAEAGEETRVFGVFVPPPARR